MNINDTFKLKKFSGKGGWTYIDLPPLSIKSVLPFGWIVVNGRIDNHAITNQKLMPKGNGKYFLSVNAKIRKAIKKENGDSVKLVLSIADIPNQITEELRACFNNEPDYLFTNFQNLSFEKQQVFLNSIYSSRTEDEKATKITKMFQQLSDLIS